jgi:hypothetical protein
VFEDVLISSEQRAAPEEVIVNIFFELPKALELLHTIKKEPIILKMLKRIVVT